MNKVVIAIVVLAALVCVASAAPNKGHGGHESKHGEDEDDFYFGPIRPIPHHKYRPHYKQGHHGYYEPEYYEPEYEHYGEENHGHKHHGHKHIHKPIHKIPIHKPHHHKHHPHEHLEHIHEHGGKFTGRSGHKNGGHVKHGAIGAVEDRELNKGSIDIHDDERERLHADDTKLSNKLGAKGIIAGQANKKHSVDTGLRKHQKFDNNKTIINNQSSGVNDLEINRSVQDSKNAGGVAAGAIGAESQFSNTRLDADRERDRDLNAQASQFGEKEAVGAEFTEF